MLFFHYCNFNKLLQDHARDEWEFCSFTTHAHPWDPLSSYHIYISLFSPTRVMCVGTLCCTYIMIKLLCGQGTETKTSHLKVTGTVGEVGLLLRTWVFHYFHHLLHLHGNYANTHAHTETHIQEQSLKTVSKEHKRNECNSVYLGAHCTWLTLLSLTVGPLWFPTN